MISIRIGLLWLLCASAYAEKVLQPLQVGSKFAATDTLSCGSESNSDAQQCLESLSWIPSDFTVHCEAAEPGCGEWLVRFPSARPSGNATNDLAAMEWFTARDKGKSIINAPAIVVVHESGNNMIVGRIIARGLSAQGLHAFLLHLPGYGERRTAEANDIKQMLPSMKQAIADVRRARDAVVALPQVDPTIVGVQGTSLGGFVTATAAGLDDGYDRVFILLAGGNLHEVVLQGAKDAAKVRQRLFSAGVTEDQIVEMARQVEPLRLAHRLNPASTWVYNGKLDDVVPPSCSRALVQAAKLADGHHIEMAADHYSGIIYLPTVLQQMYRQMVEPLNENPSADELPTPLP